MPDDDFFSKADRSAIRNIALEEVQELSEQVPGLLERITNDPQDGEARKDLERVFHTVCGSAALAGFKDLSRIGRITEDLIHKIPDEIPLTGDQMQTIRKAAQELLTLVAGYIN